MDTYFVSEEDLDRFLPLVERGQTGELRRQVRAFWQGVKDGGARYARRQLHSLREDFAAKKAVVEALAMPPMQDKAAYVWREPQPPVAVPRRLEFRSLEQVGQEQFAEVVARAHGQTLDRATQLTLDELDGPEALARWVRGEMEEAAEDFSFQPAWWQLAFQPGGEAVGYVQPALFPGSEDEDGRCEATLYFIGVVPEQRGNGYVDDLLLKAVALLQEVGVWQIYCDTDSQNLPMIKSFERVGFEPDGIYHIWAAKLDDLLGAD